jgi:SAM-dependent methyltransferase
MENLACGVCDSNGSLRPLPAYRALPRVTSDCKPWPTGGELSVCLTCGTIQKPPTPDWLDECRRIYADYQIYHLSQGAEQVIFSPDGVAVPRSRLLVNHVLDQCVLPRTGRLLDIGCGNGAALASFGDALPHWTLCGHELSDGALPRLRRIPGFEALHSGPIDGIPGRFDLITAIHSLEHMPTPGSTLAEALDRLVENGILFLQVPNIETSPFDLLVADHRTHFSRATLRQLATRQGVAIDAVENRVLPKEISLLGRRGAASAVLPTDPTAGMTLAEQALSWLGSVLAAATDAANDTARQGKPFGIFGSSVSGIWLYGALRERTAFFVDEDASRVGGRFDGIPILAPGDAPADATVFVPLIDSIAARVVHRLSELPIRFVAPPSEAV